METSPLADFLFIFLAFPSFQRVLHRFAILFYLKRCVNKKRCLLVIRNYTFVLKFRYKASNRTNLRSSFYNL